MGPYQALPGISGVITYPNFITGKSAHPAGVPGRWANQCVAKFLQEKNAKSHTEPPAFEWAVALLKAAHL